MVLGNGEKGLSDRENKTISSREVYRNKWTRVREDVIERANGERGIYGVIDKDPACIIIPIAMMMMFFEHFAETWPRACVFYQNSRRPVTLNETKRCVARLNRVKTRTENVLDIVSPAIREDNQADGIA